MKKFQYVINNDDPQFIKVFLDGGINCMLSTHNKEQLQHNAREVLKEMVSIATYASVTIEGKNILLEAAK